MATILFAWELGGGHGHVQRLGRVARGLRACGHEPVFAVRNLAGAATVLGGDGFPVFQAPFWHRKRRPGPGPMLAGSFGDIMALQEYAEVEGLLGMVEGWQALIDLVRPRLIVCDDSPTACLAAFGVIPVVIAGNGFTVPPAGLDARGRRGPGAATAGARSHPPRRAQRPAEMLPHHARPGGGQETPDVLNSRSA